MGGALILGRGCDGEFSVEPEVVISPFSWSDYISTRNRTDSQYKVSWLLYEPDVRPENLSHEMPPKIQTIAD